MLDRTKIVPLLGAAHTPAEVVAGLAKAGLRKSEARSLVAALYDTGRRAIEVADAIATAPWPDDDARCD
jgi:hypothetical protein